MKNMKVSVKLIVSFLLVVILATIVGVIGIFGMTSINNSKTEMYYTKTVPIPYLGKAAEELQSIRIQVLDMVMSSYKQDTAGIESSWGYIERLLPSLNSNMDSFYEYVDNQEVKSNFYDARETFDKDMLPLAYSIRDTARNYAVALDTQYYDLLQSQLASFANFGYSIIENFDAGIDILMDEGAESYEAADRMATLLLTIVIVVLVAAVVISMALALYISSIIAKPLSVIANAFKLIGSEGRLDFDQETIRSANDTAARKDELGDCARGFNGIIGHLSDIEHNLSQIADGDLTASVKVLSANDTIGNSLERTIDNLNTMFGEINSASSQVSTGSKQIADGAQSLAQGSTEQAASVEELSASIGEIAQKTKENASMADRAALLAKTIMGNAEKGSSQMSEMTTAVQEINQASQSISKVIKVIDDIAFQTNILALNAAVEAARAGQHGKGFAVVAEEVRNLAAKSSVAAKDTGALIQNSMEKAELGARIAGETAESLADIVSGINESSEIVGDIAKSSEEQSLGISQINTGIDQVAQVVQQNSATAQQSAAASEQMSSQSTMLEELISQFKLKNTSFGSSLPARSPRAAEALPSAPSESVYEPIHSGDFGKY
ncbi:MAG: methyl-accepting chemotaxis protein [Oscillospiraceae bacterium]|jgi:methyl-accepting chemotaxis protein|nr:methyl-accepting chemotaxis protein [Oscillospiraceae bacterium]